MKSLLLPILLVPLLIADSEATEKNPEQLRYKIIDHKGIVQLWSKQQRKMDTLTSRAKLTSDKTIFTGKDARLHITFEPLIDLFVEPETNLSFNTLLVERENGTIRMLCSMEKGSFRIKAPPQTGYTFLFTLNTAAATIDLNSAEVVVTVSKNGDLVTDIIHGSAKVLPRESSLKTVLNRGNRGKVKANSPEVAITSVTHKNATTPQPERQPSIAILSVKSTDNNKNNLELLSNTIAEEFQRSTQSKVLFLDDIRMLLHGEGINKLLGCFSDSCLSRVGAEAGVDIVIVGNLGKLGSTHILDLKMVDVLRNKVLKRTSIKATDDLGKILAEIPGAITTLTEQTDMIAAVVEPASAEGQQPSSSAISYKESITWIFPGTFLMGSRYKSGEIDELPTHAVKLNGFFIDRFEVTRAEFRSAMGQSPSSAKGCENCPVTDVTWQEADDYCKKIGKRLPTEAEWEYTCRAGTATPFTTGVTISSDLANFNGQKPFGSSTVGPMRGKVMPVGSFKPNGWNLHDMHGNVAEWCSDWYDVTYYGNSPEKTPQGPAKGTLKVVRGGAWSADGNGIRSANRVGYNPAMRLNSIGFRCIKEDNTGTAK